MIINYRFIAPDRRRYIVVVTMLFCTAILMASNCFAGISFVEPHSLPITFTGTVGDVRGIAKADFDVDGNLDVAVTGRGNVNGLPNNREFIAILQGNGDGSFQAPVFTLGGR